MIKRSIEGAILMLKIMMMIMIMLLMMMMMMMMTTKMTTMITTTFEGRVVAQCSQHRSPEWEVAGLIPVSPVVAIQR